MPTAIPMEIAAKVCERLCHEADVDLVLPDSPRRLAVVYALAAAHAVTGSGWSLDHARQYVTTTLPGPGKALDLLTLIPDVGPLLAALARPLKRTAIYLSPESLRDGSTLYNTVRHELAHAGDIARGGLGWCAAYGAFGLVRAAGEAPCYGQSVALRVRLDGADAITAGNQAIETLKAYGLGDDGERLAAKIIRSWVSSLLDGADPGGLIAEAEADFAREGLVL